MRLAIAEAAKGHGFVSPNPKVGAVLVKNGKVVSTGYHKFFGDAHAEVNCLNSYAQSLEGDEIMYVTLEPCAHEGKQPACADYLINKGMRRVVVANMDPNPKVAGLGIKRLRAAGVNVEVGLLNEEAAKLNFGFFKYIKTNRPYLILKIAMNMFGQIAPLPRARAQISGLKAGRFVKDLRSKVDGILVGAGTLQVDNPELAAGCVNGYEPRRIVLGDVQSDLTLKVFRDQNFLVIRSLDELEGAGITSVLVEGGAQVFTSFLEQGLWDEVYIFVNEKKPGFKAGLLAFDGLPIALRLLQNCAFETEVMGEDRLYNFKLLGN